jgi:methionyl-tRNA synthetase
MNARTVCDKFHAKHVEAYDWFQLGFDYFGQTSTDQHTE